MPLLFNLAVILFYKISNAPAITVLDQESSTPLAHVAIYNSGITKSTLTNLDRKANISQLSQVNRNYFLEMMLLYYQLHIETFKKPKSLAVLHEIFN